MMLESIRSRTSASCASITERTSPEQPMTIDAWELFGLGEERAVGVEERLLLVDLPVDALLQGGRQLPQPRAEGVDEALAGFQIGGLHHHRELAQAAHALLQRIERHRGGRAVRQELA